MKCGISDEWLFWWVKNAMVGESKEIQYFSWDLSKAERKTITKEKRKDITDTVILKDKKWQNGENFHLIQNWETQTLDSSRGSGI